MEIPNYRPIVYQKCGFVKGLRLIKSAIWDKITIIMKQIHEIKEKKVWDVAVLTDKAPFTQSWDWGEILIAEGKNVQRLVVEDDNKVVLFAQIVLMNLPFGWKYAFCPKGPVGQNISDETLTVLKNYLKQQGVIFLRLEPKENNSNNLIKTKEVNPRATLILDLKKSEDELLSAMHAKTRYNIRLAQKKNLEIKNEKNLNIFLELMKKTGSRDNFRLHETKHYEAILISNFCRQINIYSEQIPVATAVFIGFGETFTYVFGASDHEYRQLMAPYLLQWSAIQIGKNEGYKFYDFFGVAPACHSRESGDTIDDNKDSHLHGNDNYEFDSNHQYAGVSRFKHGFSGNYHESPGTFDFVINKIGYELYFGLRKFKKLFF